MTLAEKAAAAAKHAYDLALADYEKIAAAYEEGLATKDAMWDAYYTALALYGKLPGGPRS